MTSPADTATAVKGGRDLPDGAATVRPTAAHPLTPEERAEITNELDDLIAAYATALEIPALPNLHAQRRRRETLQRARREIERLEGLLA